MAGKESMLEADMASGLFGVTPMTQERSARVAAKAHKSRAVERRRGMGEIVARLAERIAAEGAGRARATFEAALAEVLPLRYARLNVGQALTTGGTTPVVRERGVVEVPVASGLAVLEVASACARPFDAWEWQLLGMAARLASLVIEMERCQPTSRAPGPRQRVAQGLVGTSHAMQALRDRIQRVARRNVPVLILGESGVGKELVARQLHELGSRAQGPFIAVNCAALVETLVEAELFGIEDRTATGVQGRRGKFELADGGTLFLDEVGDLSPQAQAKLLRVVQEQSVERVGGHTTRPVDVRLVAATNRNLVELVQHGRFRMDLFYRLNCVDIEVPPLRDRREDIPALAEFFLGVWGGVVNVRVAPEAMDALVSYEWPGNVRELARVVDRGVTLAEGAEITLEHLPAGVASRHQEVLCAALEDRSSLRLWASRYARLTLARCGNNKREACRVLGITYHTLQAYLRHVERVDGSGRTIRSAQPGRTEQAEEVGPVAPGKTAPGRASPTKGYGGTGRT